MHRKKALVVGIDTYPLFPLRGCGNDAERIADLLRSQHCGFEVRTLRDQEATRSSVRKSVSWLLADADMSIFYFAGHGARESVATYLLTHDTEPNDEGVDMPWLATAASRLPAQDQTVVILLDCCHSGDATPRGTHPKPEAITPTDIPSLPGRGRVVLAACRGNETAVEHVIDGRTHGAFTHHLCEAISGAAADENGNVTLNAAYDYVVAQLRATAKQIPVMKGDQEGAITIAAGVKKTGNWTPSSASRLDPDEAAGKAEEMINRAHQAMAQSSSLETWKSSGFADACRTFEPIQNWFRRRLDLQPELLRSADFKKHSDTSQHFLARLCAIEEGTFLPNGLVGKRVGSGSFGTVWRMSEGHWSEPVCFKSFHPHDLNDREKTQRFRRGFDAMRQLDHPNIVKVLQLTELPFGFYMQFIDGPNLRSFNPATALEPDQVIDLLIGAAETLKHAHGRGVIHRDVKPENILVRHMPDGSAEPYLTDFDLAWFSTATQVTQVAGFGSHFYAAPEQMDSPMAHLAHQTSVDTYSFGQLAFFALCGRDPLAFNHDGNVKALAGEMGRKWHDSDASQQMLKLFDDCTKFRPRDRVQDFREISDRLAAVRASLAQVGESYDARKFLEQTRFNLGGDLKATPVTPPVTSLRSRSGRTEIALTIIKDAPLSCGLDVTLRPDELILEGHKSSDTRLLINQRIDAMLQQYSRDHSVQRRGAKAGAFESTIRIDHLTKNMIGVLKAREIVSRAVDILEQA